VHYSADMLASNSGARAVYHRIEKAAELVCPNEPSFGHLSSPMVIKCRAQAVADAVDKIHNERLAQVHAAASSKSG
jgi:UrcA family protein